MGKGGVGGGGQNANKNFRKILHTSYDYVTPRELKHCQLCVLGCVQRRHVATGFCRGQSHSSVLGEHLLCFLLIWDILVRENNMELNELPSDTSSSCDVESLQLAVEGEGSFNSIVQR